MHGETETERERERERESLYACLRVNESALARAILAAELVKSNPRLFARSRSSAVRSLRDAARRFRVDLRGGESQANF
jgi:hypothetical protein